MEKMKCLWCIILFLFLGLGMCCAEVRYTGKAEIVDNIGGTITALLEYQLAGSYVTGAKEEGNSVTVSKGWKWPTSYGNVKISFSAVAAKDFVFDGWYDAQNTKVSTAISWVVYEGKSEQDVTIHYKAKFIKIDIPETCVITESNASNTGIETGTNHPTKNLFPYKPKQPINVSAAFANGKALFDRLYIFGLTTNIDGKTATDGEVSYFVVDSPTKQKGSNAKTPCYIYDRSSDGTSYKYTQTLNNMNVANKPIGTIEANGQSLYFTGYCPYASCGYTSGEEGVIFIKGGKGKTIDLYFDNFNIYSRYKTLLGNDQRPEEYAATIAFSMYINGSGAALVFESSATSGTAFLPTIHLRGENSMEGTEGAYVSLDAIIAKYHAGQYSSPLQVRSTNEKQLTELTIDDIWRKSDDSGDEHTNGIYKLTKKVHSAPSIDLGNGNTVLNFKGGQIFLQNSTPPGSGEYITSFAISCRSYVKEAKIGPISGKATMYGIGNDRGEGKVNFEDGSINCTPIPDDYFNKYKDNYHDKLSMKCPKETKINGGTYSCEIYSCEGTKEDDSGNLVVSLGSAPTNFNGDTLVSHLIDAEVIEPYGLAVFTFPEDLVYEAINENIAGYYNRLKHPYGCSSLSPNENNQVNLMLPYRYVGKDPLADLKQIPWVLCSPNVTVEGNTGLGTSGKVLGGSKMVKSDDVYKTFNLVWGAVDQNMRDVLDGNYQTPELSGITVSLNDEADSREIDNETAYDIQSEMYILMPIVADEWSLFVPPFDISEIYVLESFPETELGRIADSDGIDVALKKQAIGAMDLFFYLCYDIEWKTSSFDYDFKKIYEEWKTYERTKGTNNDIYKSNEFGMKQLEHFQGNNWDAHYFLYESAQDWTFNEKGFDAKWDIVVPISKKYGDSKPEHTVVMQQNRIYAIDFPYILGQNNHDKWDYWTGKYIIFKGYGPQTILGKSNCLQQIGTEFSTSGSASLRGNATFANIEVQRENAYYLGSDNYFKNSTISQQLTPTQGFMVANVPLKEGMRVKSIGLRSGAITYEPDTNTPTGVPTIAGNATLMVQQADGGMEVIPLQPQHVEIVSTDGRLVYSGYLSEQTYFPVPVGLYLIHGAHEVLKVMVR